MFLFLNEREMILMEILKDRTESASVIQSKLQLSSIQINDNSEINKAAVMIRRPSYWSKFQVCFNNLHFYNGSVRLPRVHFRVISLNWDL